MEVTTTLIPPNCDLTSKVGLLVMKTANEWIEEAAQRPTPRDLYNGLIYEGDLGILFATSGAGKSILAVQFAQENSEEEKVLYIDCELSDKQFQQRYTSVSGNLFPFHENLIRLELDPDAEKPDGITEDDFLMQSIEQAVTVTGSHIMIVDNITYLRNDTEKARDALSLMKKLKQIKKKYALTLLVIAHTPKRDQTRPLTKNDLSGSMMLYNFCDSAIAIGVSTTDPLLRYVKQLKNRYTENIYGEDNVILYQIEKHDTGFTGFTFIGYGREQDYLKELSVPDKREIEDQILALHALGKSHREIAREVKISPSAVYRLINKVKQ